MNSFSIFAFLLCVALSYSAAPNTKDSYPTTYDNINLDDILPNKRLVSSYVKCVVDGNPCTPDARLLASESKLTILI